MPPVWVVLVGDEDEHGETVDAYVQHVFATEELASDYVQRVTAAHAGLSMHAPELITRVWAERHQVLTERAEGSGDTLLDGLEEDD
jgi:hypothetical protein